MEPNPDRELSIFNGALQLPQGQRGAYVEVACGADRDLRLRVESLLQAHERAGDFLKFDNPSGVAESGDGLRAKTQVVGVYEQEGERIGRYRILQQIGEGGCGVVYMAEQEEPVRRRVALKVIKLGMDTKAVIARFEAERQALALMDHPNIARVLDAGATEKGRPFFVMELVRGIKVTDYCDEKKLPTRERLRLFIEVCHAIQHAHQKGVIHRDIKPSNILVTLHDGVPVPKVIDFGIAKATSDQRLTDKTMFTRFEQFIGTPAYMSPEQAEMSGFDIDTRTDIYSLGVLLYELLTGQTPLDTGQLLTAGIEALRRTIREQEPVRPSTRVGALKGEELTTTAHRRGLEPLRLISLLKGDLDWIVMKSLEKDRTRRYETANGLAADILRHIHDEPILARPPSNLYRFQKSVRRNKLIYTAAGAVALALMLGAVASAWEARRAASERDAAMRAREQAEAINRFLTEDLLYQATPDQNPRERKITIEEGLRQAAKKLEQNADIAKHPELEAALRLSVGTTCHKLGLFDEAERHLRRAVLLRERLLGPSHVETLAAKEALAKFLSDGRRDFAASEALGRETWEARRRVLGPEHPQTLESLDTYAEALTQGRKFELAEPLLRQCQAARERLLGANHPNTLETRSNLGLLLLTRGEFKQAETVIRDVIERRTQTGLENTTDTFAAVYNLCLTLFYGGRTEEAEKLLIDLRGRAIVFFGPEHPYSLHIQHTLVRALAEAGHLEQAEELARATLEVRRRVTPAAEGTGRTLLYLGFVLAQRGRPQEAEPILREAEEHIREHQSYSNRPELSAWAANWLGAIQLGRKAYAKAEALLLPTAEPLLATHEMSPKEKQLALGHLIELYQEWGKPDQAAKWQKRLDGTPRPQLSAKAR